MRSCAVALLIALLFAAAASAADAPDFKDGSVTIPWPEFKEILKKLTEAPPPEEQTFPVDFTLGAGNLTGLLDDGLLDVKAEYPLSVLAKKWVSVPISTERQPISAILLDGKPASAYLDGSQILVLVKGPGEHKLLVHYAATAPKLPGPGSVSLTLPGAAAQVLTLKTGPKFSDIAIDDATMSRDKAGTYFAVLTNDTLTLHFTVALEKEKAEAAEAKEKLPAKVLAEVNTLVSIDEGFIRAVAQIAYEVRHAPVTEFKVNVPEGFEVADCTGASLASWKFDDKTREITATVGFEVTGAYSLTVVLERSTKEESFSFMLPSIEAMGVERERGFFAVQVTGGVEVTQGNVKDLQPLDVKELPPALSSGATNPIVLSFKYLRRPFEGEVKVVRHKTQSVLAAAINAANYVVQLTQNGDCVTRALYTVRNNRKQFLEVRLPAGEKTALWSTFVANKPVKPSLAKDGAILLPLEKSSYSGSELASYQVELIYYTSLGKEFFVAGTIALVLPVVDLPVSRSLLTVFAPEKYEYHRLSGSMQEPYSYEHEPGPLSEISMKDEAKSLSSPKGAAIGGENHFVIDKDVVAAGFIKSDSLMKQQSEAEQVFQTRIRAAQGAQDATGTLPARFAIPRAGQSLRFEEFITIGGAPTLRLWYASGKFSTAFNFLGFLVTLALAWYGRRILATGRMGYILFGVGAAAILLLAYAGAPIKYIASGAAIGLGAQLAIWGAQVVRMRVKPKGTQV